jgi:hypothetical protein
VVLSADENDRWCFVDPAFHGLSRLFIEPVGTDGKMKKRGDDTGDLPTRGKCGSVMQIYSFPQVV